MFTNKSKKIISLVLGTAVIATGTMVQTDAASSAKKAKLAKKTIKLVEGKTAKIKIKNKIKKATYKFASSKKSVATVSKSGVVKAKKAGSAVITVTEKNKKKSRKLGKVKVLVKAKKRKTEKKVDASAATTKPAEVETIAPTAAATVAPTVAPTEAPTATPTVAPTEAPWELEDFEFVCPKQYNADLSDDEDYYPEVQKIQYPSKTVGKDRNVCILLPKNYTTDKKYPVLYLLHGISGDEDEWKQGSVSYIIQNLVDKGLTKEMIVVMPNSRARMNDQGTGDMDEAHFAAHDNFINDLRDDLMPFINSHYSTLTDRNNTAIAGLSMGGRESLNIGLKMPETFGYIGAFEPAPGVVGDGALFSEKDFKVSDWYKDRTFLMIIKGTNDNVVGDSPLTYHNALVANGTPHFYFETGGFNINGTDGGGAHGWQVWRSSLYVFAQHIFNH
ncbi:MAG: Ig-like domain-containing protein [Eubacterium sp.]|nr:Ig-like domain-containing protein [Eubacterium sp.]